jgi:hypothetical protein
VKCPAGATGSVNVKTDLRPRFSNGSTLNNGDHLLVSERFSSANENHRSTVRHANNITNRLLAGRPTSNITIRLFIYPLKCFVIHGGKKWSHGY